MEAKGAQGGAGKVKESGEQAVEKNKLKSGKVEIRNNKSELAYHALSQAITMLSSATGVILTICGTILGVIVGLDMAVAGLQILFYTIVAFVVSFVAGLVAHFTLVSVISEGRGIREKALMIPVAIQQVSMVVGLVFVAWFAYVVIWN